MSHPTPTPRQILETLLPYLRVAAGYARQLQPLIRALPAKDGDNFFAEALTDADLSIQTLVEVALLGTFPNIRFYGEEHELSGNTKYFRSIELGEKGDYLVTLDPIDGTKFYLDGHNNYQIILTVLNSDEFEAVLAISPTLNTYYYALRGEGTFTGSLEDNLDACVPVKLDSPEPIILLGWGMSEFKPLLQKNYDVIDVGNDYSLETQIPNHNGILSGCICGTVLRSGKFIDGAALAFLAQEAGCIVTTHDGSSPPPLNTCENYTRPGLLVAATESVHRHLLEAAKTLQNA
ncbi:inositol monophosphatase family protein [Limnoraphis robusta]|uniref:Inositol monophosphatase family protein n=1 Tax=Limnoraphis robusta CCNP1315 TaxID=3110306 RepID=A0ABU5TS88_9CYAN|nr:inositol monophosphatase family protein [Limnoraphis robusta]MEA5499627.1 inositol monophosphatase family protein [Limnoraphis robusta BA-68 BA1]MEA5517777.1 inositol monophosphatase family protein [Limnoraphis robusta CCNP1315]MEA5546417.1 inositol monophosphatase family protein [Limnoraphis robusta CCNP1324]